MSTDEILALVIHAIRPPQIAVFVFGSYARRDQDDSSDIDILQVTPTRGKSYAVGKINVTCYTADQLIVMARDGALFARHVAMEGLPLIDPTGLLHDVRAAYVQKPNYNHVRRAVTCAIPVVAVREGEFQENSHLFTITAGYLLRTYLYAEAFDRGAHSFAMSEITRVIGDRLPQDDLAQLRDDQSYAAFSRVLHRLFELTGTLPFFREESLEAFIVNAYGRCELAVVLGLRILARGELIDYAFVRERI